MKNVNKYRFTAVVPTLSDGNPLLLPIDQFPVSNKCLRKSDGFPCNEIDILDRFSISQNVDEDLVKLIAQRIQSMPEVKDNGLTLEQKIRVLRPAYCQTPAEYAAYSESVYQYLSENASISVDTVEDVKQEVKQEVPAASNSVEFKSE